MSGALFRSSLGFGASGLGTMFAPLSDDDAHRTCEAAYAAGYRVFDTAPLYGHGLSELRLGRFLRSVPRDSYTLSTKVGRYLVPPHGTPLDRGIWADPLPLRPVFDYSYEGTIRALEQSASRLGIAEPDLVHIHDVDPFTHGDAYERRFDEAVTGAWRALDDLRRQGHLRAIGVGVNDAATAIRFMRAVRLDVVLIAGRYTLLDQSALDELLPLASASGVQVVAAGIFNSGILASDDGNPSPTYDYRPASPNVLERARRIARHCRDHGVALPAAAIRFASSHASVSNVLIGMTGPAQPRRNREHADAAVPDGLWSTLKQDGLLRADAPVGKGGVS